MLLRTLLLLKERVEGCVERSVFQRVEREGEVVERCELRELLLNPSPFLEAAASREVRVATAFLPVREAVGEKGRWEFP